jgi:hypothetical protein
MKGENFIEILNESNNYQIKGNEFYQGETLRATREEGKNWSWVRPPTQEEVAYASTHGRRGIPSLLVGKDGEDMTNFGNNGTSIDTKF